MTNLKKLAEQYTAEAGGRGATATIVEEEEDDVPELVEGENFEEAAKKDEGKKDEAA